jgi:hypothetical protein
MEFDAVHRVAHFDAFLAGRMGADARGADADCVDEGGRGSNDSRDIIPRSTSFSSNGTVALGDVWLDDVLVPMDVSDDERHNEACQRAQFNDGRPREYVDDYATVCRGATLVDGDNDNGRPSSPRSFIIEGRHGPVVANKPYRSRRKNKMRFQQFVASRQNNRSGSRRQPTERNSDETSTSKTTSIKAPVRSSPATFAETPTSVEQSPTSVTGFLPACVMGHDEVPAIGGRTEQKQVYNVIRVEKPTSLKSIMLNISVDRCERKSKSLTWWDDRVNMDKPFTLKTDASFDSDDYDDDDNDDDDDDDASFTSFAKSGWFRDRWHDYEADFRLKLEDIFDRTVKYISEVERVENLLTFAPCPCNGS